MREAPWKWLDDRKVAIKCGDGTLREFQLVPVDVNRVTKFAVALDAASDITRVFRKAAYAFESGQADYEGAFQKLKQLRRELNLAVRDQLLTVSEVGSFLEPAGAEKEFGAYVDILTDFSFEVVERIQKLLASEATKVPPEAPATSEGAEKQELTPAG
jgi:hypothetical protein